MGSPAIRIVLDWTVCAALIIPWAPVQVDPRPLSLSPRGCTVRVVVGTVIAVGLDSPLMQPCLSVGVIMCVHF